MHNLDNLTASVRRARRAFAHAVATDDPETARALRRAIRGRENARRRMMEAERFAALMDSAFD